ncbi:MAG: hypothetical protein WCE20_09980 [Rhizomicrobium sp.]
MLYYLVAINAIGDSLPSMGFNASTAGINNGQVLQSGSFSTVSEASIDFNPQVLACNVVEITLWAIAPSAAGANFRANLRIAGADVTATYDWVGYVVSAPTTGGQAANSDSAVQILNDLSAADTALGFVRLYRGGTSGSVKFDYSLSSRLNGGALAHTTGGGDLTNTLSADPTGISFFMSSGNISLSYQIKGY